jgi:nitrogen-specific signal transduction histidine kinase
MMQSISFSEKTGEPPQLKAVQGNPARTPVEDDLFGTESEGNPAASFMSQNGKTQTDSKPKETSKKAENPFLSSFLIELIGSVKTTLVSIKNMSLLSSEKYNDPEFRKYSQKSIGEDIKKIDSVLNGLLNYIHINSPMIKSNTIASILQEVLEANEKQIYSKNIRVFKKCEADLPETFIHDEQVKFVLNSVVQYALLATPPDGTLGFLIKSFDFQQGIPGEKNNSYIEAAIAFMGGKKQAEPLREALEKSSELKDETSKLILQLVKDILEQNRGSMTYEFDPKKNKTLITVRFPMERRKVVYYEPISL